MSNYHIVTYDNSDGFSNNLFTKKAVPFNNDIYFSYDCRENRKVNKLASTTS